ncbi:hypothetical protein PtA15_11A284 [Puccinia triticina]|uniref:Reverse transcriptase domain-containing protein n=1 Tax=Puccinia triticina TaxID=208348 RepID=A0ABY7CWC5_9BASI|nr:uncharacterized protein PtA15_11A284 [Puccinia triticina]WAQ89594.1 hypothetical protein PtA15_11A284 [Puccinia triticina]
MFQLLPRLRNATSPRLRSPWHFLTDGIRANHFVTWSSSRQSESEEANDKLVNGNTPLDTSGEPLAPDDQQDNGCATTGRLVTLRTFLVHALKLQSPIVQLDLKSAFHHLLPRDSSERPGDTHADSSDSPSAAIKWTPTSRCKAVATWLEDHRLKRSRASNRKSSAHASRAFQTCMKSIQS